VTNRLFMDTTEFGITNIIGGDGFHYPHPVLKPRQFGPARGKHGARLDGQRALSSAPSQRDHHRQGHADA
jgi:hypothetical protein